MIQDLHSHTYYSFCGKDSPEEVIKTATKGGIEVLGITDHNYGICVSQTREPDVNIHKKCITRYYEHIKLLKEKYKNEIKLLCGIEIATFDPGYPWTNLLPPDVDVSIFDYCLVEHLDIEGTSVDDIFAFAKRCACPAVGIAHTDLPGYVRSKGLDLADYLKRMADENIFWEMNVNFDSIHKYNEHQYVKDFFENDELIELVRKSGVKISVGFDGHNIEDYDAERVKTACQRLEKLSIPLIEL